MTPFSLLMLAVQPSTFPPPSPPPPPRPGTEYYDRARASYEEGLRRDCMSERGIAIAVAEWSRAMISPDSPRQQPVIQELGEAALTPPIDLERLERALEADAAFHAARQHALVQSSMRVMRALDPADRVVFGRRLTTMQPARQGAVCPAARP